MLVFILNVDTVYIMHVLYKGLFSHADVHGRRHAEAVHSAVLTEENFCQTLCLVAYLSFSPLNGCHAFILAQLHETAVRVILAETDRLVT